MRLAAIVFVLFACSRHGAPTWHGVSDNRTCSGFGKDGMAICVAAGVEYTCVATDTDGCGEPEGRVECARAQNGPHVRRVHQLEEEKAEDDQQTQNSMIMMVP